MSTVRLFTLVMASSLLAPLALAKTEYYNAALAEYPIIENTILDSCTLCHSTGTNRNPYGADYQANDRSFTAIELLDSDDDGFDNITEINALTKPGDATSVPPSLRVNKPNGGETWTIGTKALVTWTSTGNVGTDISIELWRNGQKVKTLKRTTPNDGKQRILLKETLPTGSGFAVKIKSLGSPSISDTSNASFAIVPATP